MIISAEAGAMKPDARIYQIALENLGVAPAEFVFLDDFQANVEGARVVGMAAIHFTQVDKALDELKQIMLDYTNNHLPARGNGRRRKSVRQNQASLQPPPGLRVAGWCSII